MKHNIPYLKQYNITLKASGYSEFERLNITQQIFDKYNAMLDFHSAGSKPFYRNRKERKANEISKLDKTAWFRKLGYAATLNIPATPQGELAQKVREVLQNSDLPEDMKIMVREENGLKLSDAITNAGNPWPEKNCQRKKCIICDKSKNTNAKSAISCWDKSVNYNITCDICSKENINSIYRGETGRSGYSRSLEYVSSFKSQKENNPLVEHKKSHHNNIQMNIDNFTMQIVEKNPKPLNRLISESIYIQKSLDERSAKANTIVLNSRTDYHQPSLVKVKSLTNPLDA